MAIGPFGGRWKPFPGISAIIFQGHYFRGSDLIFTEWAPDPKSGSDIEIGNEILPLYWNNCPQTYNL